MFLIEIAGLKVLYTGDYSREEDRHLVIAEAPPVRPDVMICESTFGVHTLPDRKDKEEQFTSGFPSMRPSQTCENSSTTIQYFTSCELQLAKPHRAASLTLVTSQLSYRIL